MNKVYIVIGLEAELYGIYSTKEKADSFSFKIEEEQGLHTLVYEIIVDSENWEDGICVK
jgi:hypothetical protein